MGVRQVVPFVMEGVNKMTLVEKIDYLKMLVDAGYLSYGAFYGEYQKLLQQHEEEEEEDYTVYGFTAEEWDYYHKQGIIPPEACEHDIVDTGMKIGWCKKCNADFVLNQQTQTWERKK